MEEIQQEEKKHNGNDIFHIKEKIYEMILYGNPQLKDFPKTERYVLAGDIRKTSVVRILFTEKQLVQIAESVLAEAKKKWETNENLTTYIENKQQTTPVVATLTESTK